MKALRRIDDGVARFEGWLVVTLVLGIVGLAALQVFLRNAFDSGLSWGDEALRWATLWIAFLGASLATHRGKHIAIDIASRALGGWLRRVVAFSTSLAAAAVAGALAWGCYRFVSEIGIFEPALFEEKVSRTFVQMVVPASLAVMSLRFLLQAFRGPRDPVPTPSATTEPKGEEA